MGKLRFGVAFRLALGLAAIAGTTVVAGLAAIQAFDGLRADSDSIAYAALPRLMTASRLARDSETVVANAPALVACDTQFGRQSVVSQIGDQLASLQTLLDELHRSGAAAKSLATLEIHRDELAGNLHALDDVVHRRIDVDRALDQMFTHAQDVVHTVGVDHDLMGKTAPAAAQDWLFSLDEALDNALAAGAVKSPQALNHQRQQFESLIAESRPRLAALPRALRRQADSLQADVEALGGAEDGVFAMKARELELLQAQQGVLQRNRMSGTQFVAAVANLVDAERALVAGRATHLNQVTTESSRFLMAIVLLCVGGAVGFFLYIERRVIRRLSALQDCVQARVLGENVTIPTAGDDEISDIARALAFFIHTIDRREEALTSAKEAAEAGGRAKTEFLAVMSHEIRTPMNGILGMTRLVQESHLDHQQRDFVETIRLSAESLLTVLDDILDFSKLESGKIDFQHSDFDLRRTIDGVISLLGARAAEKGITLLVEIAPEVPEILCGDAARLRQLLINLVGNAVKFTEHGGVSVRVLPQLGGRGTVPLLFEVVDTGIGIAEKARDKLFKSFSQADSTISRQYGGTGLGLAICKRIVDLQGGSIGVDSVPGEGARFWFRLGFDLSSGRPLSIPSDYSADNSLPSLSVLVAEDNPVNQKVAGALLRSRGHDVMIVADGRQAVEAVQSRYFDVVLMDMQMPEMDGLEATQAIRALPPPACKVPIVALTANAMKGDMERCLAAGMDDYVAKPVNPESLQAALARQLGQRRAPRIDSDGFNALVDRLRGGAVMQMLDSFERTTAEAAEQLRQLALNGDLAAMGELIRSQRVSAGNLALSSVAELAQRVEAACSAGNAKDAQLLLLGWPQTLLAAISAARQALAAHLELEVGQGG
jgi:signal transduction histidine kinase/DNA-binding response OmpR family regulator